MSSNVKEYQTENYIEHSKNIRFHPDLNFGEKMFYAEMESMSKNSPVLFSARRMSKLFGVSHQTILNWVKKLVQLDMIEINVDYVEPNYIQKKFIKIKIKK